MDKDLTAAQHGDLPEPSPEVIEAYLRANEEYWRRIDDEPMKIGKWRNGTVQEATAYALRTAIAAERAAHAENYEFQQRKADLATATVYQFHYAMKDVGWHPGRTDDNLCDIIRAKGAELSTLRQQLAEAWRDAERYRWLKSKAGFGIRRNQVTELSVMLDTLPNHINELDAAIDAAIAAQGEAKPPGVERALFEGE